MYPIYEKDTPGPAFAEKRRSRWGRRMGLPVRNRIISHANYAGRPGLPAHRISEVAMEISPDMFV